MFVNIIELKMEKHVGWVFLEIFFILGLNWSKMFFSTMIFEIISNKLIYINFYNFISTIFLYHYQHHSLPTLTQKNAKMALLCNVSLLPVLMIKAFCILDTEQKENIYERFHNLNQPQPSPPSITSIRLCFDVLTFAI